MSRNALLIIGLCYQFYRYRFYQLGPHNSCYRTYQFRADNLSGRVPEEASKALSPKAQPNQIIPPKSTAPDSQRLKPIGCSGSTRPGNFLPRISQLT